MKLSLRRFSRLAGAVASLAALSIVLGTLGGQGAWAQTTRTIKIVVPVPPGGGMDFLTRLLAEQIGRTQGLTTLIGHNL